MRTRLALVSGLVLGAAVAGGAVYALPVGRAQAPTDPAAAASTPPATAEVTRRTLESTEELDGTLGYAGTGQLVNQLVGTVTAVPDEGDVLGRDDPLLEVNGRQRAVVLYGARPAWRTLRRGIADGADVRQLENNLHALGFLPSSISPDQHFDGRTETAVRRWQKARAVTRNGIVHLGEVAFTLGPIRLASVSVTLGSSIGPGLAIATTTSAQRVVSVNLRADRQSILAVGASVGITLPDDSTTTGTVTSIGKVATSSDGGTPTVRVDISLDDPEAAGRLDGAAVKVVVVRERREDVLTVPVDALLALLEGGYAVEVVNSAGATHLVAVQLGLFQDSDVQVTGKLSEGDLVVVPA